MPSTEVDEEIAGVAGEDVTDTQNTKEHFKKKYRKFFDSHVQIN